MATSNPRMTYKHGPDGRLVWFETFKVDGTSLVYNSAVKQGTAYVGRGVKLTSDDTVGLCAAGDPIFGRLDGIEADGSARVQLTGFGLMPAGASPTLTIGAKVQGAVDGGAVGGCITAITATDLPAALLTAKTRGTIVNNDVTTAVVVWLG